VIVAADTNVLVRYLLADDPGQSARARAALEGATVLVLTTVLLEAAWVLGHTYAFPKETVARSLATLIALPNIKLEEPERIALALQWAAQGMDLPDAIHLAGAQGADVFLTFDRRLAKVAREVQALAVDEP
jgi:predicted nucleic-acid-binding protein